MNPSLTNIDLGSNHIGDEGANALAEALAVVLTNIDLGSNHIGDEGAKGLAEALKVNTSLTHINLHKNNIGEEGAKGLAEALQINNLLTDTNLRGNGIDWTPLEEVNIKEAYEYEMTPLHIASEKGHTKIVSMLLAKEGMGNDGWEAVYAAIWSGHTEIVSMLLAKEGIDINEADYDYDGCTLVDAAGQGRRRCEPGQQ